MEKIQPAWRDTAVQMMPQLMEQLQDIESPYLLWFDLWEAFEDAYREPRNQFSINRIYQYAAWCVLQPQSETAEDDLPTCVTVCFYEHIPTCAPALKDMPNWFSKEEFNLMQATFKYHATEEQLEEMKALFA